MPSITTRIVLMLQQNLFETDEDDDLWPGDLRDRGIGKWYIVERTEIAKNKPDKSLGYFIEVECPCCEGDGRWTANVECPGGGSGCDHDVEVECDTCDSQGTVLLVEEPLEGGGVFDSTWKFTGCTDWEKVGEKIEVPPRVLKALKVARGAGEDPRQIGLFDNVKEDMTP